MGAWYVASSYKVERDAPDLWLSFQKAVTKFVRFLEKGTYQQKSVAKFAGTRGRSHVQILIAPTSWFYQRVLEHL